MKSHVLRLVGNSRSRIEVAERCSAPEDEQRFRFPADAEEVSEVSCYPERRQNRREHTAVRSERRAS
jgi:hypothetical protein